MNKNEIVILDAIVYKSPNHRLDTRIYYKHTDQKQYLNYHSAYPRNQKKNQSLKASLSDVEEFAQKITTLKKPKKYNQLKYRKHPTSLLNQAIHKVRNMNRLTILRPSPTKKTRITFDLLPTINQEILTCLKH